MASKVVLAYSGGLDTTTIIPWLKDQGQQHQVDYEIIAVCVDVGQGELGKKELAKKTELDGLAEKAFASGASQFQLVDAKQEFVTDFIWPTLQAGAVYEDQYLLGTAMARPLIAQKLVEIALQEGAEAICHGATGKGNDQVRFELAIKALAPQLKIIAPWRLWDLKSREDEIAYLEAKGLGGLFPVQKEDSYSRDRNLWHLSHEGLDLENPGNAPQYERLLQLTQTLANASDQPESLTLTFKHGIPTALNGEALSPVALIAALNELGGRHGVGIADMIENRLVGIKSRGVYETPAGTILYAAHQQLEHLCLDRQSYAFKQTVGLQFAELVYNGLWFTPLREALSAFASSIQGVVNGTVTLTLYKGNVIPAGAQSPDALYSESLASFTTGDLFNHHDAEGFINLFGLPLKTRALLQQGKTAHKTLAGVAS